MARANHPSSGDTSGIPNAPQDKRRKSGRPPRPPRCVVQLRQRNAGKVVAIMSITVDCSASEAMRRIHDAFEDVSRKFRRSTDDVRWSSSTR